MSVLKEYRCTESDCGGDFVALVSVCPRCGSHNVKRVFLTPVGINRGVSTPGSARSIDKTLAREFAKQNIADFSNTGGENKVRYNQRVSQMARGTYATSRYGLTQPPIRAFVAGAGDFSPLEKAAEYGFNRSGLTDPLPWAGAPKVAPPESWSTVDQGPGTTSPDMVQVARATPLPQALKGKTQIIRYPRR